MKKAKYELPDKIKISNDELIVTNLKVCAQPCNIAEDFFIGKSHIQISDDFCKNKTDEEVDRILERIAKRIINRINNLP